jgi:hypothetical protein
MLVFTFGIPKSGSTLAFQIRRSAALFTGHSQRLLPPQLRSPGHQVNFHRTLVIKTHDVPGPAWAAAYRDLVGRGQAACVINHRDPRHICLALRDAGAAARARREAAFAKLVTLDDAAFGPYLDTIGYRRISP